MNRTQLIAAVMLTLGGSAAVSLQQFRPHPDRGANLGAIPMQVGGFTADERRFDNASYDLLKADTTTLRLYRGAGGATAWLFVAYFSSQDYGSQIHSPRHCLPGGGWKIENGVQPYHLQLGADTISVNRLNIVFREQRQLMLYWFVTRSGPIRNEFALKLDLMKNALRFRPTDAAIVRVTVPYLPGESEAAVTARAERFLALLRDGIAAALPFTS